ncbi:MAG: SDR family NAD(P)-dependent oxidoreductase [Myxococcales bacterium]|nr:SDR family NAD(P)-dependent oxidoreductase [Myxococcales bacterium]
MKDRTVLITGAAGGIGRATALAFAREGASIVAADIDVEGLAALETAVRAHGVDCRGRRVDVSNATEVQDFAAELDASAVEIDVLVNNAGVLAGGFLLDTSLETWRWLIGINVMGPIHFNHCFVPGMVARRRGHVVNIASGAGIIGLPTIGAYSATKFAVVGLSQAMRAELAMHGIGVTVVCPGVIKTDIVNAARKETIDPKGAHGLVHRGLSPEAVAAQIVAAVRQNTAQIFPTVESKFGYLMSRVSPLLVRSAMTLCARLLSSQRTDASDARGDRSSAHANAR